MSSTTIDVWVRIAVDVNGEYSVTGWGFPGGKRESPDVVSDHAEDDSWGEDGQPKVVFWGVVRDVPVPERVGFGDKGPLVVELEK